MMQIVFSWSSYTLSLSITTITIFLVSQHICRSRTNPNDRIRTIYHNTIKSQSAQSAPINLKIHRSHPNLHSSINNSYKQSKENPLNTHIIYTRVYIHTHILHFPGTAVKTRAPVHVYKYTRTYPHTYIHIYIQKVKRDSEVGRERARTRASLTVPWVIKRGSLARRKYCVVYTARVVELGLREPSRALCQRRVVIFFASYTYICYNIYSSHGHHECYAFFLPFLSRVYYL